QGGVKIAAGVGTTRDKPRLLPGPGAEGQGPWSTLDLDGLKAGPTLTLWALNRAQARVADLRNVSEDFHLALADPTGSEPTPGPFVVSSWISWGRAVSP